MPTFIKQIERAFKEYPEGKVDDLCGMKTRVCAATSSRTWATHSRFFTTGKLYSNALCEIRGPAAYGSGESLLGAEVLHAESSN